LTRSHYFSHALRRRRDRSRPRLPLCDKSVDLKRRPPKSRPTATASEDLSFWGQARLRGSGPQGLRRPRFSFFLFTCQTSRNPKVPSPPTGERSKPRASDHYRKLFHTGSVRSFEGAPSRRNADGAPYGRYIGFYRRRCQHIMSEKYHGRSAKTNVPGIAWHDGAADPARSCKFRNHGGKPPAPYWRHIPRPFFNPCGGRCQFGGFHVAVTQSVTTRRCPT
jgi:hypothetical protein